jgi:hypothetical protein
MNTARALIWSFIAQVIVGIILIPIALSPWRVEVALYLLILGTSVLGALIYVHVSEHKNEQDLRHERYKFQEEQPLAQGIPLKGEGMPSSYYVPYQQQQHQHAYLYQGGYDEHE